jgi:hypothetical protein
VTGYFVDSPWKWISVGVDNGGNVLSIRTHGTDSRFIDNMLHVSSQRKGLASCYVTADYPVQRWASPVSHVQSLSIVCFSCINPCSCWLSYRPTINRQIYRITGGGGGGSRNLWNYFYFVARIAQPVRHWAGRPMKMVRLPPTQHPMQRIPGTILQGLDIVHSLPCSAKFKNRGTIPPLPNTSSWCSALPN